MRSTYSLAQQMDEDHDEFHRLLNEFSRLVEKYSLLRLEDPQTLASEELIRTTRKDITVMVARCKVPTRI